jgi:hypothetical protein
MEANFMGFNSEIMDNPKFWEILEGLSKQEESIGFKRLCQHYKITTSMLNSFLSFLNQVGYPIKREEVDGTLMVIPPTEQPKFTMHFNLFEWLAFQAHFPTIGECYEKPFAKPIVQLISAYEDQYKDSELFSPLTVLDAIADSSLDGSFSVADEQTPLKHHIELIEACLLEDRYLKLHLKGDKVIDVYPRKIVHLDGHLSLIGEDLSDCCIFNLFIKEITHIENLSVEYKKNFSNLEINEFINSIRVISENELRLILKIHDMTQINLEPSHLHMGTPTMVTNSDGDHIWAASVEPCEAVFEWIFTMGRSVEILDPSGFRQEYLDYCVEKLKKAG